MPRKPSGQPAEGLNLAAADRIVVCARDDLENQGIARHPTRVQGTVQGLSAEIEEELILGTGVYPDGVQGTELARVAGDHAHGIPVEPLAPGIRPDLTAHGVDGEYGGPVGGG